MKKPLIALLTGGALLLTGAPAFAETAKPTLGPFGYGSIKLGMSAAKAKATGKIVLKMGGGLCSAWDLKAYPTGKGRAGLYISKKAGVAVILAQKGFKTPRGIGLGSTIKRVKQAYPKAKNSPAGILYVSVPGNAKAFYAFIPSKGKVKQLAFGLNTQDCVN